jgi:BNR repeat protein/hemolysin type calcium-binding protein
MRLVGALLASLLLAGTAAAARIVGTSGNDLLAGTPQADTILGREGRDRLIGGVGGDFLHGGPGKDLIDGGPGSDRVVVQYDGARDSVRCGPGADVVNADLSDTVAADCELVGRRLSRDPHQDPESQHETEVEPDSLTVGRTTVATFQVGRRFSGAATNIGFAVSTDDGRTWRSGLLPGLTLASRPAGPNERASDPVVAYDALNRVWLIATLALEGQTTRLTVSRSPDGVTWSDPVDAAEATAGGVSFDKEWIACDNGSSSPFKGRCYLVYTDTLRGDSLGVSFSTDGGLTWSAPVHVPVTDAVGAFPVIRANGELVIPFLWAGRRIGSSLSTDGGGTFGQPVLVADIGVRNVRGLRFFPLPSADVDPSGRIWLAWHDCRFSAGCERNSAVVATSADSGRTWTEPAAVTSGRNAMLPAIGIHPTTGRVSITYHVVRPDGGIDVELVEIGQDRRRLAPPRRLSSQTMRPEWLPDTTSGRMLADYISVHYAGARPLVVWVLASEPVGSSLRQAVYATLG